MKKNKQTPVMKQFWGIKDKNPNSIVLFRMGDFYETFEKDALITSDVLGIALTKRSNGAASSVALATSASYPCSAISITRRPSPRTTFRPARSRAQKPVYPTAMPEEESRIHREYGIRVY